MSSLVPLLKQYNVTMEEDDNELKISYKHCNGFVICYGRIGLQPYMNFIYDGIYTLGLDLEG